MQNYAEQNIYNSKFKNGELLLARGDHQTKGASEQRTVLTVN